MLQHNAKLVEILPDLAGDVARRLEPDHADLAIQVNEALIDRWTHDPYSGANAVYIYIVPHRSLNVVEQNVIGLRHGQSIPIEGCEGMIVVDTDNFGRVSGIEVLFRPDVAQTLQRAAAVANGA